MKLLEYSKNIKFVNLIATIGGFFLVMSGIMFSNFNANLTATITLTSVSNQTDIKDPITFNRTLSELDSQKQFFLFAAYSFLSIGLIFIIHSLIFGFKYFLNKIEK